MDTVFLKRAKYFSTIRLFSEEFRKKGFSGVREHIYRPGPKHIGSGLQREEYGIVGSCHLDKPGG